MNKRNITHVSKKLDEDFPSLPKKTEAPKPIVINRPTKSSPAQTINTKMNNSTSQSIVSESFTKPDVRTPEKLLQTDISQHDFNLALYSTLKNIPDPPYDAPETTNEDQFETPLSYPQTPNMRLIQPEFFSRYDLSTLFFIFFYSPGTSQQYFAGRELKKRDWVYHMKYQTWFHRISEPTEKTSQYEIAKYEYFDHSTSEGWCVRQRPQFRFEYNCIEK